MNQNQGGKIKNKMENKETQETKRISLFKPEVYCAMQETLKGPSRYRGAEEAFEMFYADRQLQDFLRAYAKKEDIVESNDTSEPFDPIFSQAGRDRKIILIDDSKYEDRVEKFFGTKAGIYIGPRQNRDAALLVYEHLGDIISGQSMGFGIGEVVNNKGKWKIKLVKTNGANDYDHFEKQSFLVSQAPLFDRISKAIILNGLEKAVKKILGGDKK